MSVFRKRSLRHAKRFRFRPSTALRGLSFLEAAVRLTIAADLSSQAAHIAFNGVFSLGPLLALATTLLSLVPDTALLKGFQQVAGPYIPAAVRPLLDTQIAAIVRPPSLLLVTVFIVGLLWSISSATASITVALGHVGYPLHPTWLQRRLRALLLGFVAALGLALSAIAASIGPRVIAFLGHLSGLRMESVLAWAWLRWPLSGIFFGVAAALFVGWGTRNRPPAPALLAAATTSGLGATGVSSLLGLFLAYAPSLGGAYGTAGTVFATLFWLYLLSWSLLLGAIVARVVSLRTRAVSYGARSRLFEKPSFRKESSITGSKAHKSVKEASSSPHSVSRSP